MQITSALLPHWTTLLTQGVLTLLIGVVGWLAPQASLHLILFVLAGYFFIDGLLRIWLAVKSKQQNPLWWLLLIGGVISTLAAIVTISAPELTALLLLYFVAAWAFAIGVIELVLATKLRHELKNEWILLISGAISILFSIYIATNPGAGIITLMWLIASYAVVFGILMIVFALKLKKLSIPNS